MSLTLFLNDLYKTQWICKVQAYLTTVDYHTCGNKCTLDNSTCKNIIFSCIDDIVLNRWHTDLSV